MHRFKRPNYINDVIKFKKLHPDAQIPKYAHNGDSGMDLISVEDTIIPPKQRATISTGISMELPRPIELFKDMTERDHKVSLFLEAQVRSRSGLAAKHGIFVLNSPGTVDNSYRGEIKVILYNTSEIPFVVEKGMKIAQMVIAEAFQIPTVEVDELNETDRGAKGFNSSGLFIGKEEGVESAQ